MNPSFRRILVIAGLSGFIALSWEILWARLFNYATGSRAPAFGAMLGSYLLGLALGSLWSMRWHHHDVANSAKHLKWLILISNIAAFLVIPLASWIVVLQDPDKCWFMGVWLPPWTWSLGLVSLASALQGTTLPLMCHLAIPADLKAGSKLSHVYLANIIGSGAGSLLTGFLLMEYLTTARIAALLVCLALIVCLLVGTPRRRKEQRMMIFLNLCSLLVACSVVFQISFGMHKGLWERLFWKQDYVGKPAFAMTQESRHGVINIDSDLKVYGNGAYDGQISTALTKGDYHVRPYFISAVHPEPLKNVLVIGMSAGAWTQIIASHPDQPQVEVVEISHSYIDIIKWYPQVSSILTNPRVNIHIDDGRRWLKRNPDRKFDCILMNTTHHWREFASGLLSEEFLTLAKKHLEPNGVVMWNCTDSGRAAKTGMVVFPHTMMCLNNCIASNVPLVLNQARWKEVLGKYQIDGKPVFDLTTEAGKTELDAVVKLTENDRDPQPSTDPDRWWIVGQERMHRLWGSEKPITDDNLGHEY